jgi:effector-binding domain-containing protein
MFDRVDDALNAVDIPERGRKVILYWGSSTGDPNYPVGQMVECGVEWWHRGRLPAPLERSHTPAGLVASTIHHGEYHGLRAAHEAVERWCAERGRPLRGPNWEVYESCHDDTGRQRTDVFYLLA